MNIGRRLLGSLAACAALCGHPQPARSAQHFDVLIRNAMVYDGTGRAPFKGEVGLRGDRIAYVGKGGAGAADQVIDAGGKALAPGFINILAHLRSPCWSTVGS